MWLSKDKHVTVVDTFSYLDAGGEQIILEIVPSTPILVKCIWIDTSNLTQTEGGDEGAARDIPYEYTYEIIQ